MMMNDAIVRMWRKRVRPTLRMQLPVRESRVEIGESIFRSSKKIRPEWNKAPCGCICIRPTLKVSAKKCGHCPVQKLHISSWAPLLPALMCHSTFMCVLTYHAYFIITC